MSGHQKLIHHYFQKKQSLNIEPLHGGDINAVYSVFDSQTNQRFVVKINEATRFPKMLEKEAHGLEVLTGKGLEVPNVKGLGEFESFQYLVLQFVENGIKSATFWDNFGRGLAQMHQSTQVDFGLSTDNYIGSLKQSNKLHASWAEFFINERVVPQVKLAHDSGTIDRFEARKIETIAGYCEELWPKELPALLHGDLWSGNFIAGKNDQAYLIDPAVYYGHREMDLGMMHLFGGFDSRLFEVYDSEFPLEKGWKKRIQYNQLYPLLVHLNLFGRSYLGQILKVIEPFR